MKKEMKRIGSMVLAGAMVLSLTACGGSSSDGGNGDGVQFKDAKIGVALYQDSGVSADAIKAYLAELGEELNVEFTYSTFSSTDEATNVATVQQLISSGVDGIIATMDLGTESILAECEAAGVYYAGFLSDFETSYTNAKDAVFGNEMFLGTVSDGPCTDNAQAGQWYFDSVVEYNERNPENPIDHVAMAMFPSWAYPGQALFAEQFTAAAEEYNKTAETPITVDPVDEEVDVLQFSPLDSTYFSKHPDIDAIIGFAAGTSFIYPTMVSAGVDDEIKLFTCGYEGGEEENFGSNGTQTYQQLLASPVEAIAYPLVLMVNKINGVEFSDMPETAERIDSSVLLVNSDEDMDKFLGYVYCTGNVEDMFWTAEDVADLTAVANPDATYAGLVETVQSLTIDAME